jgi:hypothetical protein
MSAASKPVLVVTRPPLPTEVTDCVNRDFIVRLAETPESVTSDNIDVVLGGRVAPSLVTA